MKVAIPSDSGDIEASGEQFQIVERDEQNVDADEWLLVWEDNEPEARATSFRFIAAQGEEDPDAEVLPVVGEANIESALSLEAMSELLTESGLDA